MIIHLMVLNKYSFLSCDGCSRELNSKSSVFVASDISDRVSDCFHCVNKLWLSQQLRLLGPGGVILCPHQGCDAVIAEVPYLEELEEGQEVDLGEM